MSTRVGLCVAALLVCSCGKDHSEGKAPAETPPAAPANPPAAAPAKPKAEVATPQAKLQRYLDCWKAFNGGKYDDYGKCFAPDGTYEQVDSVPALLAQGTDKILDIAKSQHASFPDLVITPQLVIVSGNDVAAIIHVLGTNTGDVAGMKSTGKKLGVFEAEIATWNADGTLSRDRIFVDQPTVYHQLKLAENDSSPNAIVAHAADPVTLISDGGATEQANKAVVEKNLDAFNKKNAKAMEALATDDVKLTYHGEKQVVAGKKAYAKWLGETLRSTKNGFIDVKGLWTAGDWVAISDTFTGTPSEEVVGKDADPKQIEEHEVQFFRVRDGKIAEQQIFANRLETEVQLGIVDPDELARTLSKAGK